MRHSAKCNWNACFTEATANSQPVVYIPGIVFCLHAVQLTCDHLNASQTVSERSKLLKTSKSHRRSFSTNATPAYPMGKRGLVCQWRVSCLCPRRTQAVWGSCSASFRAVMADSCRRRVDRETARFSFCTTTCSGTFRGTGAKFQMARIPQVTRRSQTSCA